MQGKKVVLVIALVALIAVPAVFATGIGVAAGLPLGGLPGSNVMLSLKLDSVPLLMGIGFSIGSTNTSFGFTGDWWAVNSNLFSFVNFYLGPGFYVGYAGNLMLGGRLPVGLNIFPIKNLELFVEIAPTLAVQFGNPVEFPVFGFQGAFGLRFWF